MHRDGRAEKGLSPHTVEARVGLVVQIPQTTGSAYGTACDHQV